MAKKDEKRPDIKDTETNVVLVRRRQRTGCGCFSTVLLILAVFLCGYLWRDKSQIFANGEFRPEALRKSLEGLKFWSESTSSYLDPLRRQLDRLYTRAEDMEESGEFASRLSDLRTTLDGYKDKATNVTAEMWGDIEEKTSGLIKSAKENDTLDQGEKVLDDLEELQKTIRLMKTAEEKLEGLGSDDSPDKEGESE